MNETKKNNVVPLRRTHRLTVEELKAIPGSFQAVIREGYHLRVGDEVKPGPFPISLDAKTLYGNLHKVENQGDARDFLGLARMQPRIPYADELRGRIEAQLDPGPPQQIGIDPALLAEAVATASATMVEQLASKVVEIINESRKEGTLQIEGETKKGRASRTG